MSITNHITFGKVGYDINIPCGIPISMEQETISIKKTHNQKTGNLVFSFVSATIALEQKFIQKDRKIQHMIEAISFVTYDGEKKRYEIGIKPKIHEYGYINIERIIRVLKSHMRIKNLEVKSVTFDKNFERIVFQSKSLGPYLRKYNHKPSRFYDPEEL